MPFGKLCLPPCRLFHNLLKVFIENPGGGKFAFIEDLLPPCRLFHNLLKVPIENRIEERKLKHA